MALAIKLMISLKQYSHRPNWQLLLLTFPQLLTYSIYNQKISNKIQKQHFTDTIHYLKKMIPIMEALFTCKVKFLQPRNLLWTNIQMQHNWNNNFIKMLLNLRKEKKKGRKINNKVWTKMKIRKIIVKNENKWLRSVFLLRFYFSMKFIRLSKSWSSHSFLNCFEIWPFETICFICCFDFISDSSLLGCIFYLDFITFIILASMRRFTKLLAFKFTSPRFPRNNKLSLTCCKTHSYSVTTSLKYNFSDLPKHDVLSVKSNYISRCQH